MSGLQPKNTPDSGAEIMRKPCGICHNGREAAFLKNEKAAIDKKYGKNMKFIIDRSGK